jgi:hypothetical protein
MPGSADRARALAAERDVQAVVWISRSEDGFALWVYDEKDDRVLARKLSTPPPFDAATAASVALAIKTLLRHSEVPPPGERANEPPPEYWMSIMLLGGLRPNATSRKYIEPRFGLAATAWHSSLGESIQLGLGVGVTTGLGVPVQHASFAGRWYETSVVVAIHGRFIPVEPFDLTLIPSAGFDVNSMHGIVVEPRREAGAVRLNWLAALHGEAGYRLSRPLRVALRIGLASPFRTQSYLVHGEPIFRVASPMLDAWVGLEAGLL